MDDLEQEDGLHKYAPIYLWGISSDVAASTSTVSLCGYQASSSATHKQLYHHTHITAQVTGLQCS